MQQDWLNRAKFGDQEAYYQAFSIYEKDLYRLAYIQMKNETDALDLVQEVAFRSFKYINSLKQDQFFKTWLVRILINASNDLLKKRNLYETVELTENVVIEDEKDLAASLTLQMVLTHLSPTERQIVSLKYYEDYTFEQIASITAMKIGSVKTVLYRALAKLKKELQKEGFDGL